VRKRCDTSIVGTAILVTGMSGVGKSATLVELSRRGFETTDTDFGPWIEVVDGERMWREDLIEEMLCLPRTTPLFVQGTVANQWRFYDRFDAIVLLTAPIDLMLQRVASRTGNAFGQTSAERNQIVCDTANVVPLLRSSATHELDTTRPLCEVADELAALATGITR
jgi:hypothetical protein